MINTRYRFVVVYPITTPSSAPLTPRSTTVAPNANTGLNGASGATSSSGSATPSSTRDRGNRICPFKVPFVTLTT